MLYLHIHQLRERKFNITQIAEELKISRPTVYKYLEMNFEEVHTYAEELYKKPKKLDFYHDWILAWLEEYPHLSAAQIRDWLMERYADLNIGESTVRLYVKELREIYQIEKKAHTRQYTAVAEQPMGKQIQVDWGETKQKTVNKTEVKLYFIAFVLANSRYKYVEWQDRPFTTKDTIRCHENAFNYFGGRTEELVYDQDNLIAVSENAGDILLTGEFQAYVKERQFNVYLCRKADPESKGMIENVVKYIKGNFADSRIFKDIGDWNDRAWCWLERTGNQNVHHTTKKRPIEVFTLEKQHLLPVSPILSEESTPIQSLTRNVGKDNTVRYASNRYSVPIGTYNTLPNNEIRIEVRDDLYLIICHPIDGATLAEHVISPEKGKLIQNRNHLRDRSKQIEALKMQVLTHFKMSEQAISYVEEIFKRYPRYRRDQLLILLKVAEEYPPFLEAALTKCIKEKLYSANDFRDLVSYLVKEKPDFLVEIQNSSPIETPKIAISTRSLDTYTTILGGAIHE